MDRETEFVVKEGKNATLLCEVKGDPEPQIQWFFKEVEVDFGRFVGDDMSVYFVCTFCVIGIICYVPCFFFLLLQINIQTSTKSWAMG